MDSNKVASELVKLAKELTAGSMMKNYTVNGNGTISLYWETTTRIVGGNKKNFLNGITGAEKDLLKEVKADVRDLKALAGGKIDTPREVKFYSSDRGIGVHAHTRTKFRTNDVDEAVQEIKRMGFKK